MGSNKKITDILRAAAGKPKPFTSAVILAAGQSLRMGGSIKKQFAPVCGIPAFIRAAQVFDANEYIDEIVIVTAEGDVEKARGLCAEYDIKKLRAVTAGGESRQQSALLGFLKTSSECAYVAIHDGARCLVSGRDIDLVVSSAYSCGAAIASVPVTDTVKQVKGSIIEKTPDRAALVAAATPQVFRSELYRAAAVTAARDGFEGTDDSSLCERLGVPVRVVETSRENIKLTFPSDIIFAEAVIASRGE